MSVSISYMIRLFWIVKISSLDFANFQYILLPKLINICNYIISPITKPMSSPKRKDFLEKITDLFRYKNNISTLRK